MLLSITEELGRFEEFFSEVVYPVWPLWLAGALVAAAVAIVIAYRLRWHAVAWEHRLIVAPLAAVVIAAGAYGGYYAVSPLFERNTVCEASPIPGAGAGSDDCEGVAMAATMPPTATPAGPTDAAATQVPDATAAPTATPFSPHAIRQGEFQSADDFHFTYGDALLIETEPGRYTVRFENFSVRNGPDVFVLLSSTNDYTDSALNLGSLKGTDGAFNYDVPPGTDVSQFASVIIWCRQFDVLFGHAELQ